VTKAGQACQAFVLPGRGWCWAHDPANAERAQAARTKGAIMANKLRALEGRRSRLDSPAALARFAATVLWDVADGKMLPEVGRCIFYGLNVQRAILESSDLERRLEQLEQRLATEKGKRWAR
jgi:hypothetical protein